VRPLTCWRTRREAPAGARAVGKRIAGREHRFQKDTNHIISKHIVGQAIAGRQAIACEDLTGIRERTNKQPRGKTERRRSNSWAFYQLRAFLAYKCVGAGVPFVLVNPAYTSQMCHCCFVLGDRSGKRFWCINPACAWRGVTPKELRLLPDWWHVARSVNLAGGPVEVLWSKGLPDTPSAQPCAIPRREPINPRRPDLWAPIDCGECPSCLARKAYEACPGPALVAP